MACRADDASDFVALGSEGYRWYGWHVLSAICGGENGSAFVYKKVLNIPMVILVVLVSVVVLRWDINSTPGVMGPHCLFLRHEATGSPIETHTYTP